MKFSNKSADILKALCAAFVIIASANACTEVDDRLGGSLLPQNQQMHVRVKNLEGVDAYLYRDDSLVSSRSGYVFYGQETDANGVFGARKNHFAVQFLPSQSYPTSLSSSSVTYNSFGIDPILDSAYIMLPFYDVHGDSTLVQTFDIYKMLEGPEALHRDSIYYTNFPIDEYKDAKLFSFTHSGRKGVSAKLDMTAEGRAYLESIINMDMDDYRDSALFREKYHGIYVTPADGSPKNAAVYGSSLSNAGLALFSRLRDSLDLSAIHDTLVSTYTFYDQEEYLNVSINMVDYDYAGSTLGGLETATNGFTDTLETSPTQPLIYLQPMGGVTGYLRFSDELIKQLRGLRNDDDGEYYPSIMVNQAMMYIHIEDDSTAAMNAAMKRVGSYINLRTLTAIPDYMYSLERYQQSQSSTADYVLPYNGFLNRSNGYYELDITSYVQQLSKENSNNPDYRYISPVIHIAPEAYGLFNFGESVLKGEGISIRLTYTLIDGDKQ